MKLYYLVKANDWSNSIQCLKISFAEFNVVRIVTHIAHPVTQTFMPRLIL